MSVEDTAIVTADEMEERDYSQRSTRTRTTTTRTTRAICATWLGVKKVLKQMAIYMLMLSTVYMHADAVERGDDLRRDADADAVRNRHARARRHHGRQPDDLAAHGALCADALHDPQADAAGARDTVARAAHRVRDADADAARHRHVRARRRHGRQPSNRLELFCRNGATRLASTTAENIRDFVR
eukprot:5807870-Prymnesium_polylepis.1